MAAYIPHCGACHQKAINGDLTGCGGRHWKVTSYPFDPRIYAAKSAAAAKWADFKAACEAGYYKSGGFHAYLMDSPVAMELPS